MQAVLGTLRANSYPGKALVEPTLAGCKGCARNAFRSEEDTGIGSGRSTHPSKHMNFYNQYTCAGLGKSCEFSESATRAHLHGIFPRIVKKCVARVRLAFFGRRARISYQSAFAATASPASEITACVDSFKKSEESGQNGKCDADDALFANPLPEPLRARRALLRKLDAARRTSCFAAKTSIHALPR